LEIRGLAEKEVKSTRVKFSHRDIALVFLLISILLSCLSSVLVSKLASFTCKWFLRLSRCAFLAFLINVFTDQARPFWVLFIGSLLGYGLIESVYIWLRLAFCSALDFPLFIKYTHEEGRLVWPEGKAFEEIRQALVRNEFKFAATLAVKIGSTSMLLAPIFYSSDGAMRLQLLFPNVGARRTLSHCILTSYMRSGAIFITHNLQAPISVFYVPPFEAWKSRFSTVEGLIRKHGERLKKSQGKAMCLSGENCLRALNGEQLKLEEVNIAHGYCEWVDGRANVTISFPGRYRLWVKSLLSAYLGL
jgi:hypothetical protein